jgi:predicted N-acetyltransferase YhbS
MIRASNRQDRAEIRALHLEAFGPQEGPEIAGLVEGLFDDPTAAPLLSLVAVEDAAIVGHVLFSRARLGESEGVSARILAPLAVLPGAQGRGIGRQLIQTGLDRLKAAGVDLVFVLGHPGYYPRVGFSPAGVLGLEAPYPIAERNAGAWMVQALTPDTIGLARGRVQCCNALDRPEYWLE